MKMLKFVIFVKKTLKINISKMKNIVFYKFINYCHYTGECRVAAHSICVFNNYSP